MMTTKVEWCCVKKIQKCLHEFICNFVKKFVNRIFHKMGS